MRLSLVPTAALAATLLTMAAAGCVSDRAGPAGPDAVYSGECRLPVRSDVVGSVGAIVAIREFRFVPDTIRIPRGTAITWVNCEEDFADEPHTTTSDRGVWTSGLLSPGDRYRREFGEPGVFPYHCEPHPFMTATVIVE